MVSRHGGGAHAGAGTSWSTFALLLICLIVGGTSSVLLGQDANWDIKNYHLYNALALLQGRLSSDLYAVGTQTFFHPLLDVPYYWLATNSLSAHPKILAWVMGLPFGVMIFAVLGIAKIVLKGFFQTPKAVFRASLAATLIGVTGIASVSQLGTTFNEIPLAGLMLCGILLILRRLDGRSVGLVAPYMIAGVFCGIAAGLKLTAAIYAPAIALAILCSEETAKTKLLAAFYFSAGWLLAFIAVWGWWGWKLFKLTGSPTFPMFNSVFKSPWLGLGSGMDDRFKAEGIQETLFYPFYWMKLGPMTVAEPLFADARFAIAFVCFFMILAVLLIGKCVNAARSGPLEVQKQPSLRFFLVFIPLAYITWESMFSIIRYAVVVEALAGILILIVVGIVFRHVKAGLKQAVSLCLLVMLAFLAKNTIYPEWGRVPYAETVFQYSDVKLPEDALVLLASKPVGYAAAFLSQNNPGARFIGLVDGAVEPERNFLQDKVAASIAQHPENMFVIFISEDFDATTRELAKFKKAIAPETCRLFSSNINKDLELCGVLSAETVAANQDVKTVPSFAEPLTASSLVSGWSNVEPWGVWSEGLSSNLVLPLPVEGHGKLQLAFRSKAFVGPAHAALYVNVSANGVRIGSLVYRYPQDTQGKVRILDIPNEIVKEGDAHVDIRFDYKTPASPQSLGMSADQRVLGLGLEAISLIR